MRRMSAAAFALALLGGCNPSPGTDQPKATKEGTETGEVAKSRHDQVVVEDAWIRLPAAPGRPGAAYFTLRTTSGPATLERVASPQAERIELHESIDQAGVSRMSKVPNVPAGPDGVISFEPGGKHAMLFGIDPAVKAGDTIALTFSLRPKAVITAQAEVHAAGDAPHSHP